MIHTATLTEISAWEGMGSSKCMGGDVLSLQAGSGDVCWFTRSVGVEWLLLFVTFVSGRVISAYAGLWKYLKPFFFFIYEMSVPSNTYIDFPRSFCPLEPVYIKLEQRAPLGKLFISVGLCVVLYLRLDSICACLPLS